MNHDDVHHILLMRCEKYDAKNSTLDQMIKVVIIKLACKIVYFSNYQSSILLKGIILVASSLNILMFTTK